MHAQKELPTIAVVGSSTLFRAGLTSLLGGMSFGRVMEAAGLGDLSKQANMGRDRTPSLILIEAHTVTASSVVAEARMLFPEARVVLMSDDVEIETMSRCFAAGLDGYLLKDIGVESLADSLRLVQMGEKVFPSRLASVMVEYLRRPDEPKVCIDKVRAYQLSEREAEILRCLVTGDSNKLIARKLDIAEATVKVHLKSILKKMRASNRTQAAIWALRGSTAEDGPTRTPPPRREAALTLGTRI